MSSKNNTLCSRFEANIWLFHDDDLSEEHMQAWEEHLQHCNKCRKKNREIDALQRHYSALPGLDIDETGLAHHISRATVKTELTAGYQPLVPPLFKKLGAILLPLAAAIMLYLRLNPVETEQKYNWDPQRYQEIIAEIDSAIADLQDDPLWADAGVSMWDQGRENLEYSIQELVNSLEENN